MKILNSEKTRSIFDEYILTSEEMINVRGGDGDPSLPPTTPPVKI